MVSEKNDVEIFVVMHKIVNLEKMKLDKIYKAIIHVHPLIESTN